MDNYPDEENKEDPIDHINKHGANSDPEMLKQIRENEMTAATDRRLQDMVDQSVRRANDLPAQFVGLFR